MALKSSAGPYLVMAVKKMCDMVGADYEAIDFNSQEWYRQHSWTEAQEEEFENWLADLWVKNREARQEMTSHWHKPRKKDALKTAQWFTFMYGWKHEPTDSTTVR